MLEQIVRPFRDPAAVVSRGIISKQTKKSRSNARIVWGDAGTLPVADREDDPVDPAGYTFKLEACNDTYKESSRKTKSKRIENPNDSSQYVMVDDITLIAFAHQTDAKILSAFSTETTAFADTTITSDPVWGDVPKDDKCKATYTLDPADGSAP